MFYLQGEVERPNILSNKHTPLSRPPRPTSSYSTRSLPPPPISATQPINAPLYSNHHHSNNSSSNPVAHSNNSPNIVPHGADSIFQSRAGFRSQHPQHEVTVGQLISIEDDN